MNQTHECPPGLCELTPAQRVELYAEARANTRHLVRTTISRHPGLTIQEIADHFHWPLETTQEVITSMRHRDQVTIGPSHKVYAK